MIKLGFVCSMLFVTSLFSLVTDSWVSVVSVDVTMVFGWETIFVTNVDTTDIVLFESDWDITFGSISGVACIFKSTSFVVKKGVNLLTDDDDDDDDRVGYVWTWFTVVSEENIFIVEDLFSSSTFICCVSDIFRRGLTVTNAFSVAVSFTTDLVSGADKEGGRDVVVDGFETVIVVVG